MLKLVVAISIVICVGVGVYFFGVESGSKEKESVGIGMELILEVKPADIVRVDVEKCPSYATDKAFAERMDKALHKSSKQKEVEEAINVLVGEFKDEDLQTVFGTTNRSSIKSDIEDRVNNPTDGLLKSLERRIDALGVARPNIQRIAGTNRISIELPGIKEPERVKKILSSSALLEFWAVGTTFDAQAVCTAISQHNMLAGINFQMVGDDYCVGIADKSDIERISEILKDPKNKTLLPARTKLAWENKSVDGKTYGDYRLVVLSGSTPLMDGSGVTDAKAQSGDPSQGGGFEVSMTMDSKHTKMWANITANNVGKQIAIVMDDVVYSAPVVNQRIEGASSITGNFSVQEAEDLANVLTAGKSPARATLSLSLSHSCSYSSIWHSSIRLLVGWQTSLCSSTYCC